MNSLTYLVKPFTDERGSISLSCRGNTVGYRITFPLTKSDPKRYSCYILKLYSQGKYSLEPSKTIVWIYPHSAIKRDPDILFVFCIGVSERYDPVVVCLYYKLSPEELDELEGQEEEEVKGLEQVKRD